MSVITYQKTNKAKLSNNFNVSEFACHGSGCCSTVKIDSKLVIYLQQIRDHFNAPVTITSGYRCEKHNKSVNGATSSRHIKGQAADIVVKGVSPAKVAAYAESIGVLGIGLYEGSDGNFVHIDTRTTKAFWYGHKQEYRSTFGGSTNTTTINKLEVSLPTLRKGSKGTYVKLAQVLLGITVDGDFGKGTETSVKNFQTKKKLTVNETIDKTTWNELFNI